LCWEVNYEKTSKTGLTATALADQNSVEGMHL
jgi:hypothetical protein